MDFKQRFVRLYRILEVQDQVSQIEHVSSFHSRKNNSLSYFSPLYNNLQINKTYEMSIMFC